MLRAAGRSVGGGVGGAQNSLSLAGSVFAVKKNTKNFFATSSSSSPSSSSSSVNLPVYFNTLPSGWGSSARFVSELEEWESVCLEEEEEEEAGIDELGFPSRLSLGPVPSRNEAEHALSSLQQVIVPVGRIEGGLNGGFPFGFEDNGHIHEEVIEADQESTSRASSVETELDWIEPTLQVCYPRTSHSEGYNRVLTAFRLLQTDPSVQRMVVSLSSDKAVWDAVMKNEAVRDFQESFYADENHHPDGRGVGNLTAATKIVKWIFEKAKERIVKFFDRVVDLLAALFQPSDKGNKLGDIDAFEDAIRSSFMLSVIVVLIVVVARGDHYS